VAEQDDNAEPEAAWIDFLNVDGAGFDRALGYRLQGLDGTGTKVLVLCADPVRAEALNAGLWTFDQASFLPHGGANDGAPGLYKPLASVRCARPCPAGHWPYPMACLA